jgi:hypothetical protein
VNSSDDSDPKAKDDEAPAAGGDKAAEKTEGSGDAPEEGGNEDDEADEPGEDSEDDDADDDDDADENEPSASPPAKSSSQAREPERPAKPAARSELPASRVLVFVIAALAAGGAGGWFGHGAQVKAKLQKDFIPAPAASGSAAGPCANFERQICAAVGNESAACMQAKTASGLLTSGTCELALDSVPAMLEKSKRERAVCDALVEKLCNDLTPDTPGCALARQKTPSFPPSRCKEMQANYAKVLKELKQVNKTGIPQNPHGMPPGHP